jgi:hypothetical protein
LKRDEGEIQERDEVKARKRRGEKQTGQKAKGDGGVAMQKKRQRRNVDQMRRGEDF